ncbi:MAG TPA: hypothetical protein PKE47_02275 [Verrucomicrobiota bacterium]|nr:hypothetical protein [Verrucomicrobiota bacterium]
MKYYIRRKEGPPILGPFSIEELNVKLARGEIGKEWVATSDLGESQEKLLRMPTRDWSDVTRLQDIMHSPQLDTPSTQASKQRTSTVSDSGFQSAVVDLLRTIIANQQRQLEVLRAIRWAIAGFSIWFILQFWFGSFLR